MDVSVEFDNRLIARTGLRTARVGVHRDATVRELVDRLSTEHGQQIRPGLLEDGPLRTDVLAVRESPSGPEPLSADSTVRSGDTVRFELVD